MTISPQNENRNAYFGSEHGAPGQTTSTMKRANLMLSQDMLHDNILIVQRSEAAKVCRVCVIQQSAKEN